jgi:prepilin signal peptidase PulO-like enzyme (type II secretory pathway)
VASFTDYPPEAPSRLALELRRLQVGDRVRRLAAHRYAGAVAVSVPLVVLALFRFGASGRFAVAAFLIPVLCVLAAIDLAEHRLPNRIVLPATAVVLTAQIALSPDRALEWVLAALGGALLLLLPLIVLRSGVGMGDVKLMLLLGAALGAAVVTGFLVASLVAGAYAAVLLARGGAEARQTAFAFGPFLVFGALVALYLQ